jgi:hypothetical protein
MPNDGAGSLSQRADAPTPFRVCRIDGCQNTHRRSLFSCRPHWSRLPGAMKREIWRTYRDGAGVFKMDYIQACEDAEAFLEGREARDMSAGLT